MKVIEIKSWVEKGSWMFRFEYRLFGKKWIILESACCSSSQARDKCERAKGIEYIKKSISWQYFCEKGYPL